MLTFALGVIFLQVAVGSMFSLVLYLALAALAIWLAFFIIGMFNPTPQLRIILTVIVALVVLYIVLKNLGFI